LRLAWEGDLLKLLADPNLRLNSGHVLGDSRAFDLIRNNVRESPGGSASIRFSRVSNEAGAHAVSRCELAQWRSAATGAQS
jgi:hypothetical protein